MEEKVQWCEGYFGVVGRADNIFWRGYTWSCGGGERGFGEGAIMERPQRLITVVIAGEANMNRNDG